MKNLILEKYPSLKNILILKHYEFLNLTFFYLRSALRLFKKFFFPRAWCTPNTYDV